MYCPTTTTQPRKKDEDELLLPFNFKTPYNRDLCRQKLLCSKRLIISVNIRLVLNILILLVITNNGKSIDVCILPFILPIQLIAKNNR